MYVCCGVFLKFRSHITPLISVLHLSNSNKLVSQGYNHVSAAGNTPSNEPAEMPHITMSLHSEYESVKHCDKFHQVR